MSVKSKWLTLFLILHWVGVVAVLTGGYLLLATEVTAQMPGMFGVSIAIGLGLLIMSPYPVIKVIQWMGRQPGATATGNGSD